MVAFNKKRSKRGANSRQLNDGLEKVRVLHKGYEVTAYKNKEGVVGKVCCRTKEFRPIEEFGIRTNSGSPYLRDVTIKIMRTETDTYKRKDPARRILSSLKTRSYRNGWHCDLTYDDLVFPEKCPILGIDLDNSYGGRYENKATVDRINNSQGYEKGNIVICSWRANRLKSDATFEELEKLYLFYKKLKENMEN